MEGLKHSVLKGNAGFTLVELMVVVLLVGILSAIAIPRYAKTVETAKANSAVATMIMIGRTNQMFKLDNRVYAGSPLTGSCSDCPADPMPDPAEGCALVGCQYLANQEWDTAPYIFEAVDPDSGGSGCGFTQTDMVACTKRNPSSNPPPNDDYTSWGYTVDKNGKVNKQGTAPKPPK